MKEKVIVAMSGGVDSSVAALLLKEQGYDLTALFMKNWDENDPYCPQAEDYDDVRRVADSLDIPHYAVNFSKDYEETVFSHFLEELKKGNTPNPDILCNREIKFKKLLHAAKQLGASFLATGHYAQNIQSEDGSYLLCKGNDPVKDQTYFLYTLQQEVLSSVLFPIGHMPKQQVREYAKKCNLSTHAKKDSTGICFIGKRNFARFLKDFIPYNEGDFETLNGKKVGRHHGVAYYTIGQRKGLGLGGEGPPWFVVGKDIERNVVLVERGENHPALFTSSLTAKELSWVSGRPPPPGISLKAKIRYRQEEQDCSFLINEDQTLLVTFKEPQRAITPQQSIVFYDGNICLGGGIILKTTNN